MHRFDARGREDVQAAAQVAYLRLRLNVSGRVTMRVPRVMNRQGFVIFRRHALPRSGTTARWVCTLSMCPARRICKVRTGESEHGMLTTQNTARATYFEGVDPVPVLVKGIHEMHDGRAEGATWTRWLS